MPRWVPSVRWSWCGCCAHRAPDAPRAAPSPSQNTTPLPELSAGSRFLPPCQACGSSQTRPPSCQLLVSLLCFQHLRQSLFADFQTPLFPRWIKVTRSDKPDLSPDFGGTLSSFCSSSSSSPPLPNPFCQCQHPPLKINFYISDTKVVLLEE